MPHSRDDGYLTVVDGPGHDLLVEGPQVLHRAAAPSGDDEVGQAVGAGIAQGGGDLPRRLLSLYPHGNQQDMGQRIPRVQDAQHIPQGRSGGRGDEGDALWISGQGLFVRGVEEPLPVQLVLELLESHVEISHPVGGELPAVELVLPIPGEHRDPPEGDDLHPVLRSEAEPGGLPPEHDAAEAPPLVLQGEVAVPRGIGLEVGDLSPDEKAAEEPVLVHDGLEVAVDLGDGIDGPFAAHSLPPASARQASTATPMALSVE